MSSCRTALFSLLFVTVAVIVQPADSPAEETMTLTLVSPAFSHNGAIPRDYTCDGRNLSPPLAWSGVPAGTRSLALIVDDPDAPDPAHPRTTWVHWMLFNIPPDNVALPEGASHHLPPGIVQGLNDWQRSDYGGPCPPIGKHRYFHKLYALDMRIDSVLTHTKADLEKAMRGHILAQSVLVGTYQQAP